MIVSYFGDSRDVIDDISWVGNTFYEDCLGLIIDSFCEGRRIGLCNPLNVDTELFEGDLELIVGAAIEVGAMKDFSINQMWRSQSTDVETILSPRPAMAVIAKN